MKKIYLEKTEEVNFDDLTEREKLIYKSGQENPPIGALITLFLAGMFSCLLFVKLMYSIYGDRFMNS